MTDDIIWSRNYTSEGFGIKGQLRLLMTAHIKAEPELIMAYDALIADISNKEKCSRTSAITKAMILGLTLYAEWASDSLRQDTLDALQALDFEIDSKIAGAKSKHVKRLYEAGRTDEAQSLCQRYNLDFEEVISTYTLPVTNADKSTEIREWLQSYFTTKDNEQVRVIKADMLDDGIITPNEWSLVRNIASSDGYTSGRRGIWEPPH